MSLPEHTIRAAQTADEAAIVAVHAAAFPTLAEANAVQALLKRGGDAVSLLAERAGDIIASAIFSAVDITCNTKLRALGLAPLAVVPRYQSRGIGAHLARAGLETCRLAGYDAVVVLGSPRYYRRLGFVAARTLGLHCEWPGTTEAFQAIELRPRALAGCSGLVTYAPEWAGV
jgi:putative acetyltransferase